MWHVRCTLCSVQLRSPQIVRPQLYSGYTPRLFKETRHSRSSFLCYVSCRRYPKEKWRIEYIVHRECSGVATFVGDLYAGSRISSSLSRYRPVTCTERLRHIGGLSPAETSSQVYGPYLDVTLQARVDTFLWPLKGRAHFASLLEAIARCLPIACI